MTSLWTSLSRGDKAQQRLAKLALLTQDVELDETKDGLEIGLWHVLCHEAAEKTNDAGEVKQTWRIVLIDRQGKTYACFSDELRKLVGNLFGVIGQPPYDPPEWFRFEARKSSNKRTFYTLIPIDPPADKPADITKKGK